MKILFSNTEAQKGRIGDWFISKVLYIPCRAHLAFSETLAKCKITNLWSKAWESNQNLDFSLISSFLHMEDVAFVIHCSVVNLRGEWWPYIIWLMLWLLNVYRSAFISIPFDHWVIQLIFFELCTFFFFSFSVESSFRSGVINFKGTDCGEQWLTVRGGGL